MSVRNKRTHRVQSFEMGCTLSHGKAAANEYAIETVFLTVSRRRFPWLSDENRPFSITAYRMPNPSHSYRPHYVNISVLITT